MECSGKINKSKFVIVTIFCIAFMCACLYAALCSPQKAEAASQYFSSVKTTTMTKTTKKVTLYRLSYLQVKIKGADASKLSWKSTKKKVAKVSSSGKIHAMKKGTATIKTKYRGKTYKLKVTVKNASKSKRLKLAKAEAKRVIKKICPKGMSQAKKAERIFLYLAGSSGLQSNQSNSAYKKNYGNEAYACLLAKKAACSGFCKAVTLMCNAAGLQSKHLNAGKWAHQYNRVKVGGKWYNMDAQLGIYTTGESAYNGPRTCVYMYNRFYDFDHVDENGYPYWYDARTGYMLYA